MDTAILIVQLLVSVILVLIILSQVKGEAAADCSGRRSPPCERGAEWEKTLFQITIVLAIVFLVISIIVVRL